MARCIDGPARRGWPATAVLAATLAAFIVPGAALASSPIVLRTAPVARAPYVQDIATTASRVAVVWAEYDDGPHGSDAPHAFVRISADRGATWGSLLHIEDNVPSDQASAAICAERYLLVVYVSDISTNLLPNRQRVDVYERDLVTGTQSWAALTAEDVHGSTPDVACAVDRAWVIFEATVAPHGRRIQLRSALVDAPGTMVWQAPIDLGRSGAPNVDVGPTVAAVNGRGYAAWMAGVAGGAEVRFRRSTLGTGPGFPIISSDTKVLKTLTTPAEHPQIAADGQRVVVQYPLDDLGPAFGLRRSTDGGATFKSQQTLRFIEHFTGWVTDISMRADRIMILAPSFWEGPAGPTRYLSTNGGVTFSKARVSNHRGDRVGGWIVVNGTPTRVEAWDGHWYNDHKLRFQRQD